MTNWNELAEKIHENAVAHGWWESESDFAEIAAMIHCELSEAMKEYRGDKPMMPFDSKPGNPEGVTVELADAVSRILDYCGKNGVDVNIDFDKFLSIYIKPSFSEIISECHSLISEAYKLPELRETYLSECVHQIDYWLSENGVDLEQVIREKHEYNKTRPYRHGNKKCQEKFYNVKF